MSTETDAEIVATCETAATLITENGWTRHAYTNADGQACAAGALLLAHWGRHGRDPNGHTAIVTGLRDCPAVPAVAEVIRERYPDRTAADYTVSPAQAEIYSFNDHRDTTQADVIEVLREVVKRHTPDTYSAEEAS